MSSASLDGRYLEHFDGHEEKGRGEESNGGESEGGA